ncbi:MAG: ribonuclease HII [Candidatus Omnitrophota bacterium]
MFYYEYKAKQQGYQFVVGIDEAGRGPLAGPVVACALLLKTHSFKNRICDSKLLTSLSRERAFKELRGKSLFGLGKIDEAVIDKINILEATKQAMEKAIAELFFQLAKVEGFAVKELQKRSFLLVDGNFFKSRRNYNIRNIIDGENKSLTIAAASIVAKVTRDRLMNEYDKLFPQYGFCRHKGYGTPEHFAALKKNGPCRLHRKSFFPLRCPAEI